MAICILNLTEHSRPNICARENVRLCFISLLYKHGPTCGCMFYKRIEWCKQCFCVGRPVTVSVVSVLQIAPPPFHSSSGGIGHRPLAIRRFHTQWMMMTNGKHDDAEVASPQRFKILCTNVHCFAPAPATLGCRPKEAHSDFINLCYRHLDVLETVRAAKCTATAITCVDILFNSLHFSLSLIK